MPIPYFFSKFIYIYKLNEESLSQRIVFVSFSVGFFGYRGKKKNQNWFFKYNAVSKTRYERWR